MAAAVGEMTEEQVLAVAAYYASLPPSGDGEARAARAGDDPSTP